MKKENKSNDLQVILTQAIEQMKMELGNRFNIDKINLAELERRTGISRAKLRHYKKDSFIIKPHGRTCFLQVLFGKNSSSFWRKFVLQNGECSRQYPRPSDPARALQTFIDFCVTFE